MAVVSEKMFGDLRVRIRDDGSAEIAQRNENASFDVVFVSKGNVVALARALYELHGDIGERVPTPDELRERGAL